VLTANFDWPFVPAILVAAVATAIVGGLLPALMVRMRDFILKLTTLAFGEAMSVSAFNIPYIGGANGFSGIPLYTTMTDVVVAAVLAIFLSPGASTARSLAWRRGRCATIRLRPPATAFPFGRFG
jgi:branched-chain amino acid transport system permease protein